MNDPDFKDTELCKRIDYLDDQFEDIAEYLYTKHSLSMNECKDRAKHLCLMLRIENLTQAIKHIQHNMFSKGLRGI
jgi:hypothetical protein